MEARSGLGNAVICLALIALATCWLATSALSAEGEEPEYIPGHPWTTVVPDPDTFDWTQQVRPGYRYRGMPDDVKRLWAYIQDRRARGLGSTWAERYTIRSLQATRLWPEPPMPPAAVVAFLRHLRSLERVDLTVVERMMLGEIVRRGMFPGDQPVFEGARRAIEYLQCGHFEARNWFEGYFGRVEEYMDVMGAEQFDIRLDAYEPMPEQPRDVGAIIEKVPAPDGSYWRLARIEVVQFDPAYNTDVYGGDGIVQVRCPYPWARPDGTHETARQTATLRWRPYAQRGLAYLKPGWKVGLLLQVSNSLAGPAPASPYGAPYFAFGTASLGTQSLTSADGFYADLPLEPMVGNPDRSPSALVKFEVPAGAPGNELSLALAVCGAQVGQAAYFYEWFDNAEERTVERSEWQEHVEQTLAELGVETTPEGRKLKELRDALAADDTKWKAFMSRESARLAALAGPKEAGLKAVLDAMHAGGATWDRYVKANANKEE